jgi:Domain of unknown function (DUF4397)
MERRMPGVALVGLATLLTVMSVSIGGVAAQEAAPATVTLVHGVRGLVADVYLDGTLALASFEPERVTDPLAIPAGSHVVAVRTAGAIAASDPLVEVRVDLVAGGRYSAVVHLAADGSPTATLYPDSLPQTPAGAALVVVRHAAAAPPVDVTLDGAPLAAGLQNANEAGAETVPGNHRVAAEVARGAAALPPETVPVAEGTATVLYLVGAANENSLVWLAQNVQGLQTAPASIRTGTDGLAAPRPFPLMTVLFFTLTGLVSATGFALAWRR